MTTPSVFDWRKIQFTYSFELPWLNSLSYSIETSLFTSVIRGLAGNVDPKNIERENLTSAKNENNEIPSGPN